MAYIPESLENLTNQFAKLPGIGRKSAMRFAYQVLAMDKADAENFANAIVQVHNQVTRCKVCQIFSDTEICPICANENRDKSIICVVEKPRDVNAFEKTREYKGVYHILHGLINPMEVITTDNLCIK